MKRTAKSVLLLALALSLAMCLAACGNGDGPAGPQQGNQPGSDAPAPMDPNAEFVFTAAGTFQRSAEDLAQDLNVTITGYKDDSSILLTVAEMPQIQYYGRWELVENKGYKIYFEDNNSTYVYVRYDPATGIHSFNYPCNFGVAGTNTLNFTYSQPDFSYDGEGLGLHPPVIEGTIMARRGGSMTLTCNEDGTLVTGSRTGTWEYLEDTDQYHFIFNLDTEYPEAFKLDEWDQNANDMGHDGVFEWQMYDYEAGGFGGTNAARIDSATLMPCGVPEDEVIIDEATGRHTFTNAQGHELYYVVDPSGQPNFFNDVYADYDSSTGTYSMYWSTNGFLMAYATFTAAE